MKKSIPTQKPSNTVKHFKPITTFTVTIRKNPIVPLKKRAINKNKLMKNLQRLFKFFDLYGQNVNLLIDKKPKFYTTCSGFISMVVISFIIVTFIGFIDSWLNNEKMTLIPSSISYSVLDLLLENKNHKLIERK